jgi:hypothetical protein
MSLLLKVWCGVGTFADLGAAEYVAVPTRCPAAYFILYHSQTINQSCPGEYACESTVGGGKLSELHINT